jgi:hypothetical protein
MSGVNPIDLELTEVLSKTLSEALEENSAT